MAEVIGYAKVRLENLVFNHTWNSGIKQPEPKRIERLLAVYRAEKCLNHVLDNIIDAILPNHCTESLSQIPDSEMEILNCQVYCLYGLHRVSAAKQYLDLHDQWWTIRLYRETSEKARIVAIRDKFSHEQKFCDGEIFRQIRYYQVVDVQPGVAAKWTARLTPTKKHDLKQLLKIDHVENCFDNLISYPGLWHPIQLGSLHRLLTLKCYQVG